MDIPRIENSELRVHITHSKPIEINDFTSSLNSLGRLYSSFVKRSGEALDSRQAKLYVETVQEGSIVILLQDLVLSSIIPFADNINTIFEFVSFIIKVKDYFLLGKGDKPQLSIQDCNDFNNIFAITAGDNKGITDIGVVDRSNNKYIYTNCTFNYLECNSGQNQMQKEIVYLKSEVPLNMTYKRVLMKVEQMRTNMNKDSGNKAIVDCISKKALPVLFQNDSLKNVILKETNPAKTAYFVDIEVQTISGKTVAYKVLELHDTVPLEE